MDNQLIRAEKILRFAEMIFDKGKVAQKAASIVAGILKACSSLISAISHAMKGNPEVSEGQ